MKKKSLESKGFAKEVAASGDDDVLLSDKQYDGAYEAGWDLGSMAISSPKIARAMLLKMVRSFQRSVWQNQEFGAPQLNLDRHSDDYPERLNAAMPKNYLIEKQKKE